MRKTELNREEINRKLEEMQSVPKEEL